MLVAKMNLLTVIPTCSDDAPLAEKLLDWIHILNGKKPYGAVVLAFAADVHAEMRVKLKISAELAFHDVSEISIPAIQRETATKTDHINNAFKHVSKLIAANCRWAWLWLEPDCVPIMPDWLDLLNMSYNAQPKRYMGTFMKVMSESNPSLFMARVAVYSPTAAVDFGSKFCDSIIPFERMSAGTNLAKCQKTKLIQQTVYDGDESKIRSGVVLVHSDKSGTLIDSLRQKGVKPRSNGNPIEVKLLPRPDIPIDPAIAASSESMPGAAPAKPPRKKREPYQWHKT
jgi:hypothetical protein